jgi:hypothetical protein
VSLQALQSTPFDSTIPADRYKTKTTLTSQRKHTID